VRCGCAIAVETKQLARAIRTESAAAVEYWWGVADSTVTRWRVALGVQGREGTEGSRRLCQATRQKAHAAVRGKPLTPEQVERRRQTAAELNLGQYLQAAREKRAWPEEHLALLGTASDSELAARLGQTENAVRIQRERLNIPNPEGGKPGWTEEELALLGTLPDAEVARRTGRTEAAVTKKRNQLGIPTADDRRRLNGRRRQP
jgi:hypothetical protein